MVFQERNFDIPFYIGTLDNSERSRGAFRPESVPAASSDSALPSLPGEHNIKTSEAGQVGDLLIKFTSHLK